MWQPISYRCGVIAAYWSNFGHFAFLSHLWGLRDNSVHLGLIGKCIVDFLLVIILNFFSLAEALRAKIDRKSAISLQCSHFDAKFQVEETSPPIIFAWIVRTMNALQPYRWQFSHKETLLQTFFKRSAILEEKRPFCVFEPPLTDLGATYDDHLK